MAINFVINQKDISADVEENKLNAYDIETFERWHEGENVPSYRVKYLAVKFMVEEDGTPMPEIKALRVFDALPYNEYIEVLGKFSEAVKEAAIPKASETPSKSPSEAESQGQQASQDGS